MGWFFVPSIKSGGFWTLKPTTLSAFEEVDLMSLQKQAKKLRMAEGGHCKDGKTDEKL